MTWCTAKLGDVFELKYGKALPEKSRVANGSTPVYGSNGTVGRHNEAITLGPTIVVGRKGSAGRIAFSAGPCWPIDTTYFIDEFGEDHDPLFWAYQLQSLRLDEFDKSTAIPGLNRDDAYSKQCSYPPLEEQRWISARLGHVAARLDDTRSRLDAVPGTLKRFRMSVLAAAFSGRLTAKWRKEHSACRDARLEVQEIIAKRRAHFGATSAREGRSRRRSIDIPDSLATIDQLPDAWAACTVATLFSVETGGTPSRKNPAYWKGGTVPWVKTGEVQNCEIRDTEERITQLGMSESNAKLFPPETLLIAMYGEGRTRGQVGRLKIHAATNQACAALVNEQLPDVARSFVYYYCLSQYQKLREEAAGGNQPNLNLEKIKKWTVPFPPLEEQEEIVRRVGSLLRRGDEISARYRNARNFADRLMPAVLAKAFRGELLTGTD